MPEAESAAGALALPDLDDIRSAQARIAPYVHRTPVLSCRSLDAEIGAQLFFKAENVQRTGAFKARGATNAVFSLSDAEARRGVVTHSSGNHGAALAYAAQRRGVPAHVVMPENAAKVAHELFAALRELDNAGVDLIWVEAPPEDPAWDGVRDRLQRAAAA